MAPQRRIGRVVTVPPLAPGFLGRGHLSAPVVASDDVSRTDPFILLMDDRLDMGSPPATCSDDLRERCHSRRDSARIGGSGEDIRQLMAEYRSGAFVRISTLSPSSPGPEN